MTSMTHSDIDFLGVFRFPEEKQGSTGTKFNFIKNFRYRYVDDIDDSQ
jgi:hypothetical protein